MFAVLSFAAGCGGGGGSSNAPPVARAQVSQSVTTGSLVTLDASNSSDPNGDSVSFSWAFGTKPAGSGAVLTNPTSARPTFIADVVGNYTITLTVSDSASSSSTTVTVVAISPNLPPTAYGGDTQEVLVGAAVTLDGSSSSDPNGDTLSFSWVFSRTPAGSSAVLSNANSARPSFLADLPGTYTATLTVSDGSLTSTSTGSANASFPNAPPSADAGPDKNAFVGNTVALDGSSSDPNGDPRTYLWQLTAIPQGSNALLSNSTSPRPTFVPDVPGTYVATLTVNDGHDSSVPDSVTITATPNPWSVAAGMPTPRDDVAVAVVGSRVYVLGGTIGGTPTGLVEAFDTTTQTWSTAAAMPNPRIAFAIASAGTRIYAMGGGPRGTNAEVAIVDELDTQTNLWTSKAPMPTKRTLAAATATVGTIYVIGGSVTSGCIDWVCKATPAVEAYDIASDTWTTLPSLPRAKIGPTAVSIGGEIYSIGGEQQAGNIIGGPSSVVHRYNIGTAVWGTVANMPIASTAPTSVVVDGKIFSLLASTARFDPVANTWTTLEAPPSGVSGRLSAASVGGRAFVFGPTATYVYEPSLDRP
jgi:K319L-like, PKD domain/Kelch motif